MFWLYRGLAAGACALGLVVLAAAPADLSAQAKKDDPKKVDPKKVDPKEMKKDKVVAPEDKGKTDVVGSFDTQDGLAIKRHWYTAGKASADTVLMFPAPGNKLNDTWKALGRALQKDGFSVMLFDWRGCGENGPDRTGGPERVLAKPELFERDVMYAANAPKNVPTKGLNWTTMSTRFRDTVLYDLMGARFALDKQNDAGQCNTNRIWIVTEGTGAQLALAWIAAESQRNTSYVKQNTTNIGPLPDFTPAALDYVGLVSLSYATGNSTAPGVMSGAMPVAGKYVRVTTDHLERRLAMLMLYGKKEGPSASKSMLSRYVSTTSPEDMKKKFKYLKEIDTSSVPNDIKGISLITEKDDFGTQKYMIEAMTRIRDTNDIGKEPTQRDTKELQNNVPKFEIGKFKVR